MNFESVEIRLKPSDILSKISEYDIFKYYCSNFKSIGVSFLSDLRKTDTPNCRIFFTHSNELKYHDFKLGETLNCWQYVMEKFGCNFNEALNIVSNDFCISSGISYIEPRVIVSNDEFKLKISNKPRERSRLEVVRQPWNIYDANFWNDYLIDFTDLDYFNIVSAKQVLLYKGSSRFCFDYSKRSPRYGYLFKNCSKAYAPYEKGAGKWMYDGDENNVEGFEQLDESSDLLVITKGLKDVVLYHKLGINAIALPSETSKLTNKVVSYLLSRFGRIIINLDNDDQGVISTNKIVNEFGFHHYYMDEDVKDPSDWVKKNKSLEQFKLMIENKING